MVHTMEVVSSDCGRLGLWLSYHRSHSLTLLRPLPPAFHPLAPFHTHLSFSIFLLLPHIHTTVVCCPSKLLPYSTFYLPFPCCQCLVQYYLSTTTPPPHPHPTASHGDRKNRNSNVSANLETMTVADNNLGCIVAPLTIIWTTGKKKSIRKEGWDVSNFGNGNDGWYYYWRFFFFLCSWRWYSYCSCCSCYFW